MNIENRWCVLLFFKLSGMLRGTNGRVLKSGEKPLLQAREVSFYEATKNSQEPIYKEMSTFTAKYFGTLETTYKNQRIQFFVFYCICEESR